MNIKDISRIILCIQFLFIGSNLVSSQPFSFVNSGQNLGVDFSYCVALGDVDMDNDLDILFGNYQGQPDKLWINDGSGLFFDSGQSIGSSWTRDIEFGDLDADGDLDFFAGTDGGPDIVWINDGFGTFAQGQLLNGNTYSVSIGDLDGDNDLDVLVGRPNGLNEAWLNNGSASFTSSGQSIGTASKTTNDIALGDVDNDGDLDALIAYGSGAGQIDELWLNDGSGFFSYAQDLSPAISLSISLGDLDNDGDLDAYVATWHCCTIAPDEVWINDGSGNFSNSGQLIGIAASQSVTLSDFDGDGDIDALVGEDSGGHHIWANNGLGIFNNGIQFGNFCLQTKIGDLDTDGDLDAVFALPSGAQNQIWLNQISLNAPPDCSNAIILDQTANTFCEANILPIDVTGIIDLDGDILNISLTPTQLSLGANIVNISVNDGNGGTCSKSVIVNVFDNDNDSDGTTNCNDDCPYDPLKISPGTCGCGIEDTDSDSDGSADCIDNCPNDPFKINPGNCGCGVSDSDSDNDGTSDCLDGCPDDPLKTDPGICGCGTNDAGDADGDGTLDCVDGCNVDPNKIDPGICGCGNSDTSDADGDGTVDCLDECAIDPNKIVPGSCGCGVPEIDSDFDGIADCIDGCPEDPFKITPGLCGCGLADNNDSDSDGAVDCIDGCPYDPYKVNPGLCGCGVPESGDSDLDGVLDCNDGCPDDFFKTEPGVCGCGVSDTDYDGDYIADCIDNCITNSNPAQYDSDCDGRGNECDQCPGGNDMVDNNNDGLPDCHNLPSYNQIIADWKCGNNKVLIAHLTSNGDCSTLCVSYNSAQAHISHGDYLGSCNNAECSGNFALPSETMSQIPPPELAVFPNPTEDEVIIQFHGSKFLTKITVFDNLGRAIWSLQLTENQDIVKLDVSGSNFSTGVYLVQATSGPEIVARRFIVSKK